MLIGLGKGCTIERLLIRLFANEGAPMVWISGGEFVSLS
jgi:hypothetical protein